MLIFSSYHIEFLGGIFGFFFLDEREKKKIRQKNSI